MEGLAKEYSGRAVVLKVDFDTEEEIAERYGVQGLPTVVFIKDGKMQGSAMLGVGTREDYKSRLDSLLK